MKIDNHKNQSQFTADVPGGQAVLAYRKGNDGTLDLYHTYVPDEARGKKVADDLVRAAIEFAQIEKLKIIPTCSYVRVWFERHPELKSLLDDSI